MKLLKGSPAHNEGFTLVRIPDFNIRLMQQGMTWRGLKFVGDACYEETYYGGRQIAARVLGRLVAYDVESREVILKYHDASPERREALGVKIKVTENPSVC